MPNIKPFKRIHNRSKTKKNLNLLNDLIIEVKLRRTWFLCVQDDHPRE